MNDLLLGLSAALIWSISTVIDKNYVLKKYKAYELFLFRSPIFFILGLLTTLYIHNHLKVFTRITPGDYSYMVGSVFFNFIALLVFWHLLTKNDSHYTLSIVQPMYICFVIILSYLFFNEKMNYKQFIGFILVLLGITMVNVNKN
jgi:drug/metabolite transporter (DMT)-like permease